ncbi:MAG: Rrf2 family transcriptional regulator [Hyphomicrobiaceae bacterium]|nr:Rrf2 family transcriptional regulator [Hyphomicrobiaceae bacterium]
MSRSTELMTASYVAAFVGARHPDRVNTDLIAKMVQTHPTRVRRIVSKLVKAGILLSSRGGNGGVSLAREANKITLADIYDAVQDQTVLKLGLHNPFSEWSDHCFIHSTFERVHSDLETKFRSDLADIKLSEMFKPWAPVKKKAEVSSAA